MGNEGLMLELNPDDPYRTAKYPSINDVYPEMFDALVFLKKFEKFKPVIAGGALWSWAAYKPARDIDIFVKSSWRTRRKARKLAYKADDDHLSCHSYGNYGSLQEDSKPVCRYTLKTFATDKDVDLVLTPWDGLQATEHFDYHHCSVAFGPGGVSYHGADYYASGMLQKRYHSLARSNEVIVNKIQKELWGNPAAVDRLEQVIRLLYHTYNNL